MQKIDMINVVVKLLKIVHNMGHSRSQLLTYISRISFTRSCLVLVLFMNDLSLRRLVLVCSTSISSVQVNCKCKKFKFSGNCQVVTFKFTLPLDPIKLSQTKLFYQVISGKMKYDVLHPLWYATDRKLQNYLIHLLQNVTFHNVYMNQNKKVETNSLGYAVQAGNHL